MNIVRAPLAGLEAPDGLIGFRAEDATSRPGDSSLVFELAERVGAQRLWHLRAGEDAVIVRAPDGSVPVSGTPVRVSVPAAAVRRFDDSGRAVGHDSSQAAT
jgi:hypothetical protein